MAGAEDREVWERRPFPFERLVRDAQLSAAEFRVVMRKASRSSGPCGPLNSAFATRPPGRVANDLHNLRGQSGMPKT